MFLTSVILGGYARLRTPNCQRQNRARERKWLASCSIQSWVLQMFLTFVILGGKKEAQGTIGKMLWSEFLRLWCYRRCNSLSTKWTLHPVLFCLRPGFKDPSPYISEPKDLFQKFDHNSQNSLMLLLLFFLMLIEEWRKFRIAWFSRILRTRYKNDSLI